MDILQTTLLGIVEGITEFLPVSSTFHLVWTAKLLGLEQTPFQKLFEVAIQAGAILAVLFTFARTLKENPSLIFKVIVAFIPTAGIGFVLYQIIKDVFLENLTLQLTLFILVGLIFVLFERFSRRSYDRPMTSMSYQEAALVGVAQSLAVIPGVSRAGAVILALMALSITRKDAAVFSFLLAVPTILAASLLDVIKSNAAITSGYDVFLLALGSLVAFLSALLVVQGFLRYLQHHTIAAFGWYRIILGAILVVFMLF